MTHRQINYSSPIPFHAKHVFRIEKTDPLLLCSVLLSDKIETALEQFKAEIGWKLRTIYAALILPGFYEKSVND